MIDYLATSKNLNGKDTPNLTNCQLLAAYSGGCERYAVEGCERLEVLWNEVTRLLQVRGSLPYFFQGHNFIFEKGAFVEAVDYLQGRLGVGLWDAYVDAIEVGSIFEVERRPKDFIKNHHAKPQAHLFENERPRDRGNFKYWEQMGGDSLKMYDAGRNILMKQGLRRREVIEQAGWSPEAQYIKIEAHIKHPERTNGGRGLLLEDCINPAKYSRLCALLRDMYEQLEPMRTLETPTDKRNLRTPDILTIMLAEEYMNNHDCGPEEAKKALFQRINAIGEETLTKADKDARKRQIRALFDKLEEAAQSEYDLSNKLAAALDSEKW